MDLAGKPASFYSTTGGVPQNGAWYSGQQYWNGTLGAPNVINNPNQQGYQQPVSAEVAAQTNPANVPYLQSLGAVVPGAPAYTGNTTGAQASLDSFGTNLFNGVNGVPTGSGGVQSFDEIFKSLKDSGILPSGAAPVAPNLVDTYKSLTTQSGVPAIQTSINDLKAQQDAIASQLQVNKTSENGKPVAMNVIQGRISQETQQAQDQYDFIGRQLARKQDELTSALGNIKTIMDLTQQDYTNASASYDRQFSQAITMFNLIHGIQQDQKTDVQRAQDNARANAQILVNTITSGNLSLNSISPTQKAQLNTLEVQSGLPVGFFSSLKMDPKANIISTSTNNGVTQVLMRNPDGSIGVQNYGTATGGSAITANTNNLKADVAAKATLDQVMAKYGNTLSPDVILSTYNAYSPWGQAKESLATLEQKYNVSGGTTSKLSSADQANIKQIKSDISSGLYTREQAVQQYPEYAQYF
jgi:hypothetical protein